MYRYVLVRLLQGIFALFLASIVVFGLSRLTGNPLDVMLDEFTGEQDRKIMAEYLGLDKPLPEQYWVFITHAARGDFGNSFRYRTPVTGFILTCAPATIQLVALAALISVLIALPAGVLGALKRGRWQDTIVKAFAILGQSLPTFWLGIVLIQLFAVQLGWLPAGGHGGIQYWILPAISLG